MTRSVDIAVRRAVERARGQVEMLRGRMLASRDPVERGVLRSRLDAGEAWARELESAPR